MNKPLELVLIGAGQRGARAYGSYAFHHPDEVRFVAVAEPDPIRRKRFADEHDIDDAYCFESWEALTAKGQLGQAALVTTQDQMHVEPAVAAMQAGYHVLLEKPMAHTLAGCVQLVQTAEQTGRILEICHVLRYSPFWRKLHDVVKSDYLGELVTVEHRENVAYWHMAHSFVRGNWRNAALSSPMILAKCCHDLDILVWNLGAPVKRLSSVGSLLHYRRDQVGAEIPERCTDNCPIEQRCPFSAIGIYLDYRHTEQKPLNPAYPDQWPFSVLTHDLSRAGRLQALQTGPYGRCVYRCDNDVVDHQIVTMELASGASVAMVMHGHSNEEHRSMRYDGTRATLRARAGRTTEITVHHHGGKVEQIPIEEANSGHGGGDEGIMADFVRVLRGEAEPLTSARVSLESHLLAFAAEEARLQGTMIQMNEFRARAEKMTG
ncbi:MAG: gfo/Idh/MocA family oxidoreductase [Caldilinea sp. CFX5]|nr:gfo/Idh/MocA family oxidoreductase [Caldilinea sp. CFX5]